MSDDNSTIGKTVSDYEAIKKHIACVKKELLDVGTALAVLGQALRDNPDSVRVDDGAVNITSPSPILGRPSTRTIDGSTFDVNGIDRLLSDLAQSTQDRTRLEATLRDLNLGGLISDG